jgi:hypothetical protein
MKMKKKNNIKITKKTVIKHGNRHRDNHGHNVTGTT